MSDNRKCHTLYSVAVSHTVLKAAFMSPIKRTLHSHSSHVSPEPRTCRYHPVWREWNNNREKVIAALFCIAAGANCPSAAETARGSFRVKRLALAPPWKDTLSNAPLSTSKVVLSAATERVRRRCRYWNTASFLSSATRSKGLRHRMQLR